MQSTNDKRTDDRASNQLPTLGDGNTLAPIEGARRKRDGALSSLLTHNPQLSRSIETWNAKCVAEAEDFRLQASHFEYEFTKALQSTDHLGVPNPLRSAICFDVLTKLSRKFPRLQDLTTATHQELERAAYMNDPQLGSVVTDVSTKVEGLVASTVQESLARRAYFTELRDVLAEKEASERHLSRLNALHVFMLQRLRNNELMVDRLAQRWGKLVLRQTLADWKKIIVRKKYTRVLLHKTRQRWTKQRMVRLFRAWNDFAVTERVRKSHDQIQQFRDNKHDFQELVGRLQMQIEGAKVETKSHREHLDLAKRHIMSLEELLAQLELRVRQSQERKLQSITNQWGKLCFAFVDCECDYLQNMLDAVPAEQYMDVNALLHKGEDSGDLLRLPSEVLVLRWINFQLVQCGSSFRYYVPSSAGFIQNFSTDMHNLYVVRHIVHRIVMLKRRQQAKPARTASTFALLSRVAAESTAAGTASRQTPFNSREELRAALAEQLQPPCPPFLCDHVLDDEPASDLMFCLLSFLVCEHPSLSTQPPLVAQPGSSSSVTPWQEAQTALNEARTMWESVRTQWTELQTPFDVLEANKATPEVTSPPQLLAKATIALQNAVHTVQYACSKRSIVMRVWGCLQRRIQQDALRLLVRRGRSETPFELVNRRLWRERAMLTTLHVAKLTAVWSTERCVTQPSDELAAQLQRTEAVLMEHHDRLRRIYRHYAHVDRSPRVLSSESARRGGNDAGEEARFFHKISACMSLAEFLAFLKDCRIFGRTQPFPYDLVQQVFAKVDAAMVAAMDSATLTLPSSHTLGALTRESGEHSNDAPREMTPAEFVEALLHIACSKHVTLQSCSSGADVATRLRGCLEEFVLPNAMRENEDTPNVFRPQLLSRDCREVFCTHQKKLRALYTRFAAAEARTVRNSRGINHVPQKPAVIRTTDKMLSVNGFVGCCQHFDLFRDSLLHLNDVEHIISETLQLERDSVHLAFNGAGATEVGSTTAAGGGKAVTIEAAKSASRPQPDDCNLNEEQEVLLTLAEFTEALAAVACYLNPDAFTPLASKLDKFFSERLDSSTVAS